MFCVPIVPYVEFHSFIGIGNPVHQIRLYYDILTLHRVPRKAKFARLVALLSASVSPSPWAMRDKLATPPHPKQKKGS